MEDYCSTLVYIDKNIISEKRDVPVLSEIISIGYPLGLNSTHSRYPLFFKGHLSIALKDNAENSIWYANITLQ